ncbi:putative C6 finger domain protein [Aspergillus ibericus CBS 121593]|uniref:Zn(2)-C6 fungal-type domain-containing protein n=1 Tax=Aspergillus ibericus CBS 121593 TaxID=1448316 RepID=A0A395GZ47_9EURO|nr:hypothetical protein BO80DRAFT_465087 [Aspergillus ibericus CBS 121593]RAL00603.1 hypothetical protein BO80DRAFT_465087 [Aspergillus ibericus CBS 121593]
MTAKRTSNQAGLGNEDDPNPKRAVKAPEPVQDDDSALPQPDAAAEGIPDADSATDKDDPLWTFLEGIEPTGLTPHFALPEYSPGDLGSSTSPRLHASEVKEAHPAPADLRSPDLSGEHASVAEGASAKKGATRKHAFAGDYVPPHDDAHAEVKRTEGVADDQDIPETLGVEEKGDVQEEEEEEEEEEVMASTKKKRGRPKLKDVKSSSGKVGRPRQTANDYSDQVKEKYRQKHLEAEKNKKPNRTNNACDRCKARRGTCDKDPYCCKACQLAKVECKMTDPNTLEAWPRGACRRYKRQIEELLEKKKQLEYAFQGSQHRVLLLENQLKAAGITPIMVSSHPPHPLHPSAPVQNPTSVASAPRHPQIPSPYRVDQWAYPSFPNALQGNSTMQAVPGSHHHTSAPQDTWQAMYSRNYNLAPPPQLPGYNPPPGQSPGQRAMQHGPGSSRRHSRSIQPQQPQPRRRRQQQQQQQQPQQQQQQQAGPSQSQYPNRRQSSSQTSSVGVSNVPSFDHNLNLETFGMNPAAAAAHPSMNLNPSLAQAMFPFPPPGQPMYPNPGPLDPTANFAGMGMPGLDAVDPTLDVSDYITGFPPGDFDGYAGATDPTFDGGLPNDFDAAASLMPGGTPGPSNPMYPNGSIGRRASHSASSRGNRVYMMHAEDILNDNEARIQVENEGEEDDDAVQIVEVVKTEPSINGDAEE